MKESKNPKRPRGSGSIFHNGSNVWWIKFYDRGIPHRESSNSVDRRAAERLLKRRLAEIETDLFVSRPNIRMDELIQDVMDDHRVNGRKSTRDVEARWRLHLAKYFTRMKACDLTTSRVENYKQHRLAEAAARATLNRELSLLKRAMRLGFDAGKVKTVPKIKLVKESNTRRGFLEPDGYARLANECAKAGLWLRALLEVAYTFGFRLGELRSMRCRQVNLLTGVISLETSKSGEPRETYMTTSVRQLLTGLLVGKKPDDFLFTRKGRQKIGDFRKTWASCCVAAGVGSFRCPYCDENVLPSLPCGSCGRTLPRSHLLYKGLIFHDLRRCGVRGLIRAGVAQKTAMMITGHLTINTFHRYQIVASADLKDATRRLELSQNLERELLKSYATDFGQSSGRTASRTVQVDDCEGGALPAFTTPN